MTHSEHFVSSYSGQSASGGSRTARYGRGASGANRSQRGGRLLPGSSAPAPYGATIGQSAAALSSIAPTAYGAAGDFVAQLPLTNVIPYVGAIGEFLFGTIEKGGSFFTTFNSNPFQPLENLFQGKPVSADTIAAVLRLGESANPVVRQFGRELALLEQGGVYLSTSGGPGRAALNKAFATAVDGLVAQGYNKQRAAQLLINVITSQTATSGAAIPVIPPPRDRAAGFESGQMEPVPSSSRTLSNRAFGQGAGAIVGALAPILAGQPELAPLGAYEGYLVGQEVAHNYDEASRFVQQFWNTLKAPTGQTSTQTGSDSSTPNTVTVDKFGNQSDGFPIPTSRNLPVNRGQTADVPTLDVSKCTTCSQPTQQQQQQLRSQQSQLEREIETEQQQLTDEQIDEQQRQLEHFHDLEQQPRSTRDIQQELQQKGQLQQQIRSELRGYPQPNQPNLPAQPSQPGGVPTVDYKPTPVGPIDNEAQPAPEPFIQRPVGDNPSPHQPGAVKFCVQCTSQSESLKFLNGEPSECSVVAD